MEIGSVAYYVSLKGLARVVTTKSLVSSPKDVPIWLYRLMTEISAGLVSTGIQSDLVTLAAISVTTHTGTSTVNGYSNDVGVSEPIGTGCVKTTL